MAMENRKPPFFPTMALIDLYGDACAGQSIGDQLRRCFASGAIARARSSAGPTRRAQQTKSFASRHAISPRPWFPCILQPCHETAWTKILYAIG